MLINILQFFASLSILVVLHECGHFFPAKWFGTKVEKFYLFFDPWFSLFKIKKGETEYGIGWLPLGGYVKISGMIDESFDKEQMAGPPQPWEFRSKPAWQRLIIMLGGVTVNMILGIVLFSLIIFKWGDTYITNDSVTNGIYTDSIGYDMGLRDGDKIKKIGEEEFTKFDSRSIKNGIIIQEAREITVERNSRNVKIPVDEKYVGILTKFSNRNMQLAGPRVPAVIDSIEADPALSAGLKKGDQIIGANGQSTRFHNDLYKIVDNRKSDKLSLSILRGKDTITKEITLNEKGKFGMWWKSPTEFLNVETQEYGFGESWIEGWNRSFGFIGDQIFAFGQMFSGKIKASESLGSVISIGKMYGETWDWKRFWSLTAMLSLLLGFLNLMPIPALDGGHVMFLLWEVFTGRKPSDKVIEYATLAGFILLIILMIYAFGLDIARHWPFGK